MELRGTRGQSFGEMAITGRRSGVDRLLSASIAVVTFGLLMALWVALWIPSAPLP